MMTRTRRERVVLLFLQLLPSVYPFVNTEAFIQKSGVPGTWMGATINSEDVNFPVSIKAALLEKAKKLDDRLEKEGKGSYSATGWSNRKGLALTPASIPGVYTADRPFYWNNIDVGCRMTVVQLGNGDLWVHSPVGLDGPLRDALNKLGTVRYVVSPNYEHLKFAPEWALAFPDAHMWGCPGLSERLPEINWAGEIPAGQIDASSEDLENCWDFNEVRPLHIDVEVNPFTGKPFFNEVIYLHVPSKTLLTTDFFWNYPDPDGVPNSHLKEESNSEWELAPSCESIPIGSQLWKIGMDKVYYPFYMNFMIKDRRKYDEIVDMVVNKWDVETLIPAHGDIIRGSALIKSVLKSFFKVS